MSAKLYYVNQSDRTALFYGMFNSEPLVAEHPDLKTWLDLYGPAKSYFMRADTPPVYPWSNGNGKVDPNWNLWIHYPGKHSMQPTGPWKAWPTHDLHVLGNVASTTLRTPTRPRVKGLR